MCSVHLQKELDLARSIAMHAGDLAAGYASREIRPETKPDLSPVTAADRECERLIAARVEEFFPLDGILGEEGAAKASRSGRRWIIDPIDGTRDFVRGLPLWAQLIGLEAGGEPVLGVVSFPIRREMYFAVKGGGAWMNDRQIAISAIDRPENALICVNGMTTIGRHDFGPRLIQWLEGFWAVRSLGGCLDAMMLASGHAEVWLESQAKPWDLAALKVILEEAGARFFNFDGKSSIYGGNGVACVPALMPAVMEFLRV